LGGKASSENQRFTESYFEHYRGCLRMPEAQKQAWTKAANREDRVYYGGPFLPPIELKPYE
jgi:hypothetical protein